MLGVGITFARYQNGRNAASVRQLSEQLQQTQAELADATVQLADANKKLGFLEASKARVQVTAYALTDDFGPDPVTWTRAFEASRNPSFLFASAN